ncbi:MAG TPA: hypothetical protein VFM69_01220 [Pricia sp.]|nr:hypothetical protein [Pricia sp.]
MSDLKETLLKKYGVPEYLLLIVGIFILYKSIKVLLYLDFEDTSWEIIGMITFFLLLGSLFIAAPMSLLDFARMKLGMKTKQYDIEKK